MNKQRFERALRQGPEFATAYRPTELMLEKPRLVRPVRTGRFALLVLATVLLLMGLIAGLTVLGTSPRDTNGPAELTVAGQILEAVNTRDLESLALLLADDAHVVFPWVDGRAGREGEVYMDEWEIVTEAFPDSWMTNLDRWGMEAHLGSCQRVAESTISCAVTTRWRILQVEIGEAWTFAFDGGRVIRLEMLRVDPDPADRLLPMGLSDLSTWQAWLRDTHPAQAARLLPSGPDKFGWMYFRFSVDSTPEEIGDSINEYLEARP